MSSSGSVYESDANWKQEKVLLAPTNMAQSILTIARGDSFEIIFRPMETSLDSSNCGIPNGPGDLARSVTMIIQLHLNLDLVNLNEIDGFSVAISLGCEKSSGSQSQVWCNFEGETKSIQHRFGERTSGPQEQVNMDVPVSALVPEHIKHPTLVLSAFAQRSSNSDFVLLSIESATVSIKYRQ